MSDLGTICERRGDKAAGWIMQARLSDLAAYWLEVDCSCSAEGRHLIPFRLMIARRGGAERLADILPRFKCKRCHRPPALAYLNETPNRDNPHGSLMGWSVQLIPRADQLAEAAE